MNFSFEFETLQGDGGLGGSMEGGGGSGPKTEFSLFRVSTLSLGGLLSSFC